MVLANNVVVDRMRMQQSIEVVAVAAAAAVLPTEDSVVVHNLVVAVAVVVVPGVAEPPLALPQQPPTYLQVVTDLQLGTGVFVRKAVVVVAVVV